jgi:hypothetical protein
MPLLLPTTYYSDTSVTILDIIHRPVFYLKRNVSETGFCLRLQLVSLRTLGPNEQVPPEGGDKIQSPKRCVLCKIQDDGQCQEL